MNSWESERARFNHDRLKNQFVQSVLRVIRSLQGATTDQEFVEDFITRLPQTWGALESEAVALLDSAEQNIGPAMWFRSSPLNRLDRGDRQWMEYLLACEWRAHSPLRHELETARAAISAVSTQCRTFRDTYLLQPAGAGQIRPEQPARPHTEALPAAVTLHERCVHLSRLLSRFSADDPIDVLAALDRTNG